MSLTQGLLKRDLSILIIFSNLFTCILGLFAYFRHRFIDIYTCIVCVNSQIMFFVYIPIMAISLTDWFFIKSFWHCQDFFPVFYLSFILILDVFEKKTLMIYYAVKFTHFPWWFFDFSNKNKVM